MANSAYKGFAIFSLIAFCIICLANMVIGYKAATYLFRENDWRKIWDKMWFPEYVLGKYSFISAQSWGLVTVQEEMSK